MNGPYDTGARSQRVHVSYQDRWSMPSTPVCLADRARAKSYTAAADRLTPVGAGARRWTYSPCDCGGRR